MDFSAAERARRIRLILFDLDSANHGGEGAGRDAIDFILQAQGILDPCIEEYLDEHNPAAAVIQQGV